MIGKVLIRDLKIDCIVGVKANERQSPQTLIADLDIKCDFERAAKSDDVVDAVDYIVVSEKVRAFVIEQKAFLLERLAVDCCRMLMEDHRIVAVKFAIYKTRQPPKPGRIGVEITLNRSDLPV